MTDSKVNKGRTPSENDVVKVFRRSGVKYSGYYFEETTDELDDDLGRVKQYRLIEETHDNGGTSVTIEKAVLFLIREHDAIAVYDEDDNILASVSLFTDDRDE